jgi:hypothetical protein
MWDLQIKCTARIHDVYHQSTERSIEEDRPRAIQAASSSNNNIYLGSPYLDVDNDIGDKKDNKDSYMTQFQGN